MRVEKQFSIFMVNKPGMLARVLSEFAREKVNILAMTMMDSVEHGVMRVVAFPYEKAKMVLANLNMPHNESDVLCVTIPNHPGAFAEIVEKLAKNHINIGYAYVTAGASGGKTTAVLKVADVKKAMRVLEGTSPEQQKQQQAIRRPPSTR